MGGDQGGEGDAGAVDLALELFAAVIGQGGDEGLNQRVGSGHGPDDRKKFIEVGLYQFQQVGEGTVPAVFVAAQEPDIGGEEADGGLDKELALEVDHAFVEGQDDGTGDFAGVGNIGEAGGVEGVASMAAGEVVEVDGVEDGGNGELVFFSLEGVVG